MDPHQTEFVGKDSDHLQLIKFWPSRTPGKGVCGGVKIFGSALPQSARSVCVSCEHFFHSYLLSGTDQPERRSACHCPLTVKHILIECPALTSSRNKHFTASSMKDLFDNVAARNIISFTKESHFYRTIYNVVTIYFILAQSLDLNIIFTLSL